VKLLNVMVSKAQGLLEYYAKAEQKLHVQMDMIMMQMVW